MWIDTRSGMRIALVRSFRTLDMFSIIGKMSLNFTLAKTHIG